MDIFEWDEETPVTANNLNEMQNIINGNIVNYVNLIVEKGKIGSNQMTTYQSGSSTNRLYNLTFSNTYTNPPIVVASLYDNEKYNYGIEKVAVGNITNTGCELLLGVNINSSSYGITYIVIGND